LRFAWSDVVWATSPIVTVKVHIKVVARRSHGSDILYGNNNEELVARRHLRDSLTGARAILEPNAVNRQIRRGSRVSLMDRACESWNKKNRQDSQE
jgi:hypothetical protein